MAQDTTRRRKIWQENIRNGVAAGIFFGLFMGVFMGLFMGGGWPGLVGALAAGLIPGLFFGVIITVFSIVMSGKMAGKLPLLPGEEIVREGPANHMVKGEGVGGWLTVTNQRLHFTSHKANFNVHDLSLPLHEIAAAETVANAGIVPNGLLIKTASGKSERFVVNGRGAWVNALGQVKGLRI